MTNSDIPEHHAALITHGEKILALAAERGLLRSRDLVAQGIPRVALTRLVRRGLLVSLGHGLYAHPATQPSHLADLARLGLKRHAALCLVSALRLHHLPAPPDETPWLAIPNKARAPQAGVHVIRLSAPAWETGIQEVTLDGVSVRVTTLARTIADCFKFRRRVGLETGVAALEQAWTTQRLDLTEMWHEARLRRVTHVMRPYLEALAENPVMPLQSRGLSGEAREATTRRPREGARGLRPIHYLGSKLRLLPTILETVQEVAIGRGSVLELFSGSGTLSYALAQRGPVVTLDIQAYARVLASAVVRPLPARSEALDTLLAQAWQQRAKLRESLAPILWHESVCLKKAAEGAPVPLCELVEHGSLFSYAVEGIAGKTPQLASALTASLERLQEGGLYPGTAALASVYYGGSYFAFAQAVDLDALLEVAHACPPDARDVAVAAVLSTASEIVNTVGKQFAQPIKLTNRAGEPKVGLLAQTLRDRSTDAFSVYAKWLKRYRALPRRHARKNRVVQADYRNFLAAHTGEFSCIYADPPYTREQYSRFYHVLETLCCRDLPDIALAAHDDEARLVRGMYRADRHQSPFCSTSEAPEAFAHLFQGARRFHVPLVLSYSPCREGAGGAARLLTLSELVALARQVYSRVEVRSAGGVTHSKLNVRRVNKATDAAPEVLLVCHP